MTSAHFLSSTPRRALSIGLAWLLICAATSLAGTYIEYGGLEVEPVAPVSQDEVVIVVGSPTCRTILETHEVVISDGLIQAFVEAQGGACGVPPPSTGRYDMEVGSLPAGDYAVEYLLSINGAPDELINSLSFTVVDAVVDIPALGPSGLALLSLLLGALAMRHLRRRG